MSLRVTFLAALLCAHHACAEPLPPGVPSGWIKFDAHKKLRVWVPDKKAVPDAGRMSVTSKIREVYEAFGEIYVMDKPLVGTAGAGSKFGEKDRAIVNLLLFRDDAEYDKWLMEDGKSLSTVHEGRYLDTIGFPLVDGAVAKERWPELSGLMSLVFIHHHFYFDPPLWLNEGLSQYFSYSSKRVKATEYKTFNEMLERLTKARDNAKDVNVWKLLERRPEALSPEEADAAWLLVHMLFTQTRKVFEDMTRALGNLEEGAFDGEQQIIDDLHRVCREVLDKAFGGEKGLQASWAEHRENVLKSPTSPAKLKKLPGALVAVGGVLELACTARRPNPESANVNISGGVRPSLPWGGKLSVNGAVGDGTDWSTDYGVAEGMCTERGSTLKWEKVKLSGRGRQVGLTIWWTPDSGAVYRFRRYVQVSGQ